MGEFPCAPEEAVEVAERECGGSVQLSEITDRRGSTVWKATGPSGSAAIKSGTGNGVPVTAREAEALHLLDWPDHFLGGSVSKDLAWVVTRWFDAPSTWKMFRPVRETKDGRERALSAAVDLCHAIADLHGSGWVHSDLQPEHALHTDTGVRLLDVSWAWCEGFEPPDIFRGGMTHLLAPELAASIGVGIRPVTPSPAAEVHSLAATLWTCVTGRWPLDYPTAGVDPKTLTPSQLRARVANRSIPLDAATPWPELQEPLREVLLAPRRQRPTAGELAETLQSVNA
ncbi:hypothetical protein ACFXPW_34625 [Streptomyces goshikiensis]|uniref:hypothetical protein n=1 Tax=Streptomyces goshikiensis TaxID=1942 RepID=UPI0036787391